MIRREVALIGTASHSPAPATAVLMPTIRPWASVSAPPELPAFSAASVWMTSSITRRLRPDHAGMERPRPLTTPAVTEPESPSGLPTAMTSCPTLRATLSVKSVVAQKLIPKSGPGRGEARVQLPALHCGDPDPLQLDAFGVADDGFEGLHYAHRDRGVGPVPDVEH
jgi:hypothetical protein